MVLGFAQAAEQYLARQQEAGAPNLKQKREKLRLRLIPYFKDKPLAAISNFDIEKYKKARLEEDATAGTVNRSLAVLSHLFNKAVEWRWLDHKPAAVKRLKEGKGRITYLTTDQIQRLLESARQDSNLHVYPFVVIGLETSMRRMEILSIRLEHVDLARRVIFIPRAKAGTREQPITAHLAEFLQGCTEALEPGQEWLFPAKDSKTGHTVSIEKAFRRVVAAAGLNPQEVVRHILRHTAITHLVQAGVDLPTVQRISGHKTLQMVVRYSHQNGEHIQAAMDKLDKRYRSTK